MHDFDGIAEKMRHAQEDFKSLAADFKRFREGKFYEVRTEVDFQAGRKRAVFYATEPLPINWSVTLGEILYNMRSSLDHAIYLLTMKYAPKKYDFRFTAFPVCLTQGRYYGSGLKDSRSGRYKLRGVPPEARKIIKRIQPYRVKAPHIPEDTTLFVFDDLANIDKHRTLNLYRLRPKEIHSTPRNGIMQVRNISWPVFTKLEDGTVLADWEPAGPLNDEVEMDIDLDFDIAFGDIGPKASHGREVLGGIHEFGALVNEILKALRAIYDKPKV
jgi:hypothetical protein